MQTTDPTGIFNRNKLSEEFSNVLPDEARLKTGCDFALRSRLISLKSATLWSI